MLDETPVVNRHRCHMAAKFGLFVDEDHSKLPTLYWLPKLHKRPYKSRFIANSSSCTTACTELSILLTPCITAIKNHVIKFCTTVYERNGKKLFWSAVFLHFLIILTYYFYALDRIFVNFLIPLDQLKQNFMWHNRRMG